MTSIGELLNTIKTLVITAILVAIFVFTIVKPFLSIAGWDVIKLRYTFQKDLKPAIYSVCNGNSEMETLFLKADFSKMDIGFEFSNTDPDSYSLSKIILYSCSSLYFDNTIDQVCSTNPNNNVVCLYEGNNIETCNEISVPGESPDEVFIRNLNNCKKVYEIDISNLCSNKDVKISINSLNGDYLSRSTRKDIYKDIYAITKVTSEESLGDIDWVGMPKTPEPKADEHFINTKKDILYKFDTYTSNYDTTYDDIILLKLCEIPIIYTIGSFLYKDIELSKDEKSKLEIISLTYDKVRIDIRKFGQSTVVIDFKINYT